MKKLIFLFLLIPLFSYSQSPTSMNLNLLGSYDYPSTQGNDIWGWVDASNNEYALVGLRSGFSVVNVTNPSSPYEEFFISDINSTEMVSFSSIVITVSTWAILNNWSCLFCDDLVRGTMMHCFSIACLVSVLWLIVGYSFAFYIEVWLPSRFSLFL